MAKRIIRTGTTADPTGDSLKNAFTKVNDNFTELYNALGLDGDGLNIGAFEFTGSVMTTTDSSAITIDQAVTITSDLTVGGDVIPQTALGGNLGSAAKPWHSLYVSNSTIYLGGTPLSLNGSGQLTVNGTSVSSTDKLAVGAKEVVLTGGANPYVTFPTVASGENIYIQGGEIASTTGAVAITSSNSVVVNTNALTATKSWLFDTDGSLYFPDNTTQTTAWTGTLTVNDSGLTINGGTGTIYQGPSGALQAGDKKGGVYHASSTSSNGLFTFGINGSGIMSAAVEGSVFIGTSMPSNNGGVTTAYPGWLVVENGGKFGADVDTLGNVILGKGVFEKFQTKQDATGTVEHDCINGHIFYHTSPDANWTANFTNLNIGAGYATSVSIVIAQGGTGYYPDAVQIGGVGQTINWQGNATPTPSTNRTDVVTFSILNNSGTYVVLGQITGF